MSQAPSRVRRHDTPAQPTLRPRALDDYLVVAYFLAWPVLLGASRLGGIDPLHIGPGWWPVVVYCVVAPFVGVLVLIAAPRARFASYVFLTMEIGRSIHHARWVALGLAAAVLLYLQTPRMRARYPTLSAHAIAERWRRRLPGRRR